MADVKIVLNSAGVNELLRSPELEAVIEGHAASMAASLGEGYDYSIAYGAKDGRVRAFVKAVSKKANQDNLDDNTMLKAMGGIHD